MRPIAQLERGMEMPVAARLHQIDGVVVGAAAQEREEIRHPVGFTKAQNIAVELGDPFHVGDVKRNMTELVRNDPFALEPLSGELAALEHLYDRALRVLEGDHLGDGRLGFLLALGLDAVTADLALELAEIIIRPDLETDADAFGFRSFPQHHRMMVDRVGEIGGVLLLGRKGETENLG